MNFIHNILKTASRCQKYMFLALDSQTLSVFKIEILPATIHCTVYYTDHQVDVEYLKNVNGMPVGLSSCPDNQLTHREAKNKYLATFVNLKLHLCYKRISVAVIHDHSDNENILNNFDSNLSDPHRKSNSVKKTVQNKLFINTNVISGEKRDELGFMNRKTCWPTKLCSKRSNRTKMQTKFGYSLRQAKWGGERT